MTKHNPAREGGGFSPGPTGYWVQAVYTIINAVLYALTGGRYLFLEGRRSGRTWHNWTHGERDPDAEFVTPADEAELVELIRTRPRLRVVGSGHSFNKGVRSETLVSLDRLEGVIDDFDHRPFVDDEAGVTLVRVRAGTRVRVITAELERRGLAVIALPSHDAQSIAGVLSTDVHGTGRDVGFVSASVVGLRIVDGLGVAHEVWRDDPLFRAAIGGIGAVGVITEVSLRCVDAFRVDQRTTRIEMGRARTEWRDLLEAHHHVNFYVFPFADCAQLHTWDRTDARPSFLAGAREYKTIATAAVTGAVIGDLLAWSKQLPRFTNLSLRAAPNSTLVMDSAKGFNRTIYHMHQELEFAVPVDQTWPVIDRLLEIYETMYRERGLPFTLFEVRFTPDQGTRSLISAGAGDGGRMWVTIACSQSRGIAEFFGAVEAYMREIDAPPHLGKWCASLTAPDMARVHGDRFDQFVALRAEYDPHGRFSNEFTDRLFGPP